MWFILGLIFTTVGTANHWFAGVHTVGLWLIWTNVAVAAVVLLAWLLGAFATYSSGRF